MDVLIAGGHGKVARRLIRLLGRDGHTARAMIRAEDQAADIESDGGQPVLCDLERDDVTPHVGGADALVFAAGAGPGSGPERKRTVDYGGAVKLIAATKRAGVRRYVMVSAMGAADPEAGSEGMRPYLRAKARADEALRESGLDYTIIRPGRLTNEPGTGRVDAGESLGRRGEIPREDVARAIVVALEIQSTVGKTFELLSGENPIERALKSL